MKLLLPESLKEDGEILGETVKKLKVVSPSDFWKGVFELMNRANEIRHGLSISNGIRDHRKIDEEVLVKMHVLGGAVPEDNIDFAWHLCVLWWELGDISFKRICHEVMEECRYFYDILPELGLLEKLRQHIV